METETIRLPYDEVERVLMALVTRANIEEYDKDDPEHAESIRQTGRCIALQVRGDS